MKHAQVLIDVKKDRVFRVHNGPVIHNLHELADSLEHMSELTYNHHVNSEKNDFSAWVHDILGDDILASNIAGDISSKQMIRAIHKRIGDLEERHADHILKEEDRKEVPKHFRDLKFHFLDFSILNPSTLS